MKNFIIPSVMITALIFIENAKANIIPQGNIGLPSTYGDCLTLSGCSDESCFQNANVGIPMKNLCQTLKICETEHSEDESSWRGCIGSAQADYLKSTGLAGKAEPYIGESLPVSTNSADARYEQMDPEHKGFLNAQE